MKKQNVIVISHFGTLAHTWENVCNVRQNTTKNPCTPTICLIKTDLIHISQNQRLKVREILIVNIKWSQIGMVV